MLESHLQEVEAGGASQRAWQQQRQRGWGARRVQGCEVAGRGKGMLHKHLLNVSALPGT